MLQRLTIDLTLVKSGNPSKYLLGEIQKTFIPCIKHKKSLKNYTVILCIQNRYYHKQYIQYS